MSANTTSPANAHRSLPIAACGGLFSALVVLILYWPARNNGFVFDDLAFLVNVPVYLDRAQWKDALLYPPFSGADTRVFFRPLAMLSFVLPMWAGHTTPYIHHVVNLAFHAANVFLVSLLAWRIFAADFPNARAATAASTLCGLVYGVYTGLTEPVLWISCRWRLSGRVCRWPRATLLSPWFLSASPYAKRHLLLSLGGHYFKAGALLKAREAFELATEQSAPALLAGLSWYELGNVDLVLGNYDQAIMDFQNALALDSDVLMARIGMGIVERRRGHPERAAAVLEEGLRLAAASALRHPYEDVARLQLGLAYAKLGRFDEAAAQLHSARDGTPRAAIRAAAEKALEALRSALK